MDAIAHKGALGLPTRSHSTPPAVSTLSTQRPPTRSHSALYLSTCTRIAVHLQTHCETAEGRNARPLHNNHGKNWRCGAKSHKRKFCPLRPLLLTPAVRANPHPPPIGCIRRWGGLKGGWLGPTSSYGPPMVPAESRREIFKLKSSWRRKRQSNILAVSIKHWKEGGGGLGGGTPPPPTVYSRSNTSLPAPLRLARGTEPVRPGQNVPPPPRDALEGKGLQRLFQKRLNRRLEEAAKAVGSGYCRLQMPLKHLPFGGQWLGIGWAPWSPAPTSNASLPPPLGLVLGAPQTPNFTWATPPQWPLHNTTS